MTSTPRTDAVQEAARALPYGSMAVIPAGHPASDPWHLARELELENNKLRSALKEILAAAEWGL